MLVVGVGVELPLVGALLRKGLRTAAGVLRRLSLLRGTSPFLYACLFIYACTSFLPRVALRFRGGSFFILRYPFPLLLGGSDVKVRDSGAFPTSPTALDLVCLGVATGS
jgi:hypothetical protein